MTDGDSGVSNLEKSSFWIYGITAMIMREPLGTMLRHASAAGLSDWQVRIEIIRVVVVLAFLARLFLADGLYFDTVYMSSDSAQRYKKRSYPVDFLAGMIPLVVGVAASTTISLYPAREGELALFDGLAGAYLLSDLVWLILAGVLRFSALKIVARRAGRGAGILILSLALALAMRAAGAGPILADQVWLLSLLVLSSLDAAMLIRGYGASAGATA